jgi:ATP-dependent 26S proteasome regulatory subunit
MALADFIQSKETALKSKTPDYTVNDLILDDNLLEQFTLCVNKIKHFDKLYHEWELSKIDKRPNGIVINFYGLPGTGKTIGAEAIASMFNKNILEVNYSDIYSELSGKSSKNLQSIFKIAKEESAVLFFDEADTILSKRSDRSHSADQDNNLTKSIMLKELDSHDGIVIFATNYTENYDPAFERRILTHIEFKLPNEQSRKKLFEHMLSKKIPGRDSLDFDLLSLESNGLSCGDIKNVVINTLSRIINTGFIVTENFIDTIKGIKLK